MYKNKFKRIYQGSIIEIPDIIEYLRNKLSIDPTMTITVGCDSIQKRKVTVFAITIMMYNSDIKNGAHIVFFRESCSKIKDNQLRLYREAQYLHDVGTYLDSELSSWYKRADLTDLERKRYKYHLLKCSGEYTNIQSHREPDVMNNLILTSSDLIDFKLVDLHIDFNPYEGTVNDKGIIKNRSYTAYKSFAPWLRGLGFRTWAKNLAHASTSAADLLLKD